MKTTKRTPRFKIWINTSSGESIFGDGKWRLLREIHKTGSLRAAAIILGMSYRKAWGDLKKAEENLGVKLVEKQRGGAKGGETKLTKVGAKWLEAYGAFRQEVEEQIRESFKRHLNNL